LEDRQNKSVEKKNSNKKSLEDSKENRKIFDASKSKFNNSKSDSTHNDQAVVLKGVSKEL
jgi:hypothetical protein